MGNEVSTTSSSRRTKEDETATDRARKVAGDFATSIQKSARKLETNVASSEIIDSLCGPYFDDGRLRGTRSYASVYSEDGYSEEDTQYSETDTMDSSRYDRRHSSKKDTNGYSESESMLSDEYSDKHQSSHKKRTSSRRSTSEDTESMEDASQDSSHRHYHNKEPMSVVTEGIASDVGPTLQQPLASSFAKRCYFTKAGIGKTTQHYEGLTLTGNIVLMLASAMKLKGCPTICDEDLRRVEQTYPNQFSRLPDELLLSSGWRRISKYCHFSNKPVPDGIPFFHSRERCHPSGGYYFLVASAVGMVRPIDVEPLTRDTLVLLETDYPTQCDAAPPELIQDASLWTLVDKFCFFSGGPINAEEDVYYQADFDGNSIYMLAFLSPSLTPEELYKLNNDADTNSSEPGLKAVAQVQQVESVYDLTERDFDDLKLYHLGPCRALPSYILQPTAWTKVLPPHFLIAKENAMIRAHDYERAHAPTTPEGQPQPMEHQSPMGDVPPMNASYEYQQQQGFHHHHHVAPSDYTTSWAGAPPPSSVMQPGNMVMPQQQQSPNLMAPSSVMQQRSAVVASSVMPQQQMMPPHHQMQQQQPFPQPQGAPPPPPAETAASSQQQPFAPVHPPTSSMPYYNDRSANTSNNNSFAHESSTGHDSITYEQNNFQREVEEEGAFLSSTAEAPIDEALAARTRRPPPMTAKGGNVGVSPPGYKKTQGASRMDPPEDEPPSLSRRMENAQEKEEQYQVPYPSESGDDTYGEEPYSIDDGTANKGKQNGAYYDQGEYYDSPEKTENDGTYYTRQEEYYDSPENQNPNADYQGEHDDDDAYYSVPGAKKSGDSNDPKSNEGSYSYDPSLTNPSTTEEEPVYSSRDGDEYYTSPEAEKKTSDNPNFGGDYYNPEYSNGDGESWGPSPPKSTFSSNPEQGDDYTDGETYDEPSPRVDSHADDGEFAPIQDTPDSSFTDPQTKSVASSQTSGRTTPSSAMRGAHELIKRNRQKRQEAVRKQQNPTSAAAVPVVATRASPPRPVARKQFDHETGSAGTWDTGSELTSVVSASSVWTDTSNAGDRSSRRALILQMAKARMKSNKNNGNKVNTSHHSEGDAPEPIAEEDASTQANSSVPDSKADISFTEGDLD